MSNRSTNSCTLLAILAICLGCGGEQDDPEAATMSPPMWIDLPAESPFTPEEGFTAVSLADFVAFPAEGIATWREFGGRLECNGDSRGYVYTQQPPFDELDDFTLRLDVRYPAADEVEEAMKQNTGVLLFIDGEHRVWPRCLEVQGRFDELATIKSNARDVTIDVTDDAVARETARRPAGEWNAIEIVSRGGAVTTFLNGTRIAVSRPTELRRGRIGLQSEGNPVHFRNVRVRPGAE